MEITTLVFPVRDGWVYLARAKKQHNPCCGRLNGYGGKMKPEDGGYIRNTACREYSEEAHAGIWPEDLELVAVVDFFEDSEYKFECHIFFVENFGSPLETSEMGEGTPFPIDNTPYDEMMPGDVVWLKPLFEGARFHAECHYSAGNKELLRFVCRPLVP